MLQPVPILRSFDEAKAREYFTEAGKFADQYYGQLSLDALGKSMPQFVEATQVPPTSSERAEFQADPLVQALRAIGWGPKARVLRSLMRPRKPRLFGCHTAPYCQFFRGSLRIHRCDAIFRVPSAGAERRVCLGGRCPVSSIGCGTCHGRGFANDRHARNRISQRRDARGDSL